MYKSNDFPESFQFCKRRSEPSKQKPLFFWICLSILCVFYKNIPLYLDPYGKIVYTQSKNTKSEAMDMYLTQFYPTPRSYMENDGSYSFGARVIMRLSFTPSAIVLARLTDLWLFHADLCPRNRHRILGTDRGHSGENRSPRGLPNRRHVSDRCRPDGRHPARRLGKGVA